MTSSDNSRVLNWRTGQGSYGWITRAQNHHGPFQILRTGTQIYNIPVYIYIYKVHIHIYVFIYIMYLRYIFLYIRHIDSCVELI